MRKVGSSGLDKSTPLGGRLRPSDIKWGTVSRTNISKVSNEAVISSEGMEPQSSWPGARSPTRHDVPQASELPDTSFLSEFKARLLAHQDAKIHQRRVPVHLLQDRFDLDDVRPFTYPLTVLSGFPTLPSNEELGQLRAAFVVTFQKHAFVEPIINRERLSDPVPPYLDVAVACLGSVLTPASMRGGMIGDDLFLAGFQLTTFMAEVDNRHSRLLELPAAVRFQHS